MLTDAFPLKRARQVIVLLFFFTKKKDVAIASPRSPTLKEIKDRLLRATQEAEEKRKTAEEPGTERKSRARLVLKTLAGIDSGRK